MIVFMIACTIVSLLLTIVHKERFLNECIQKQDINSSVDKCGGMYAAALVGSILGCLIGLTMIVRTYSMKSPSIVATRGQTLSNAHYSSPSTLVVLWRRCHHLLARIGSR